MKESYFESICMIERLHRLFLDVISLELDRLGILDISNVQALILYNIGRDQITVGELTQRGYYLGSNVSYNLRKMIINEYVVQNPSAHDRRSIYIKLSDKGTDLFTKLDRLFSKHSNQFSSRFLNEGDFSPFLDTLKKMEGFWRECLAR